MPVYTLRINGSLVTEAAARHSLVRYELSYDDPAQLVIRFHNDWRNPPFTADARVEFFVDGVRRFCGLFDPERPYVAADNDNYVEYTAVDLCEFARRLTPYSTFGKPSFTLSPGPLSAVLNQYVASGDVVARLVEAGIDTEFNFVGGAAEVECFPVSLELASLDGALRQIAAAAAGGVGVFLDSSQSPPRYTFVSLYGADVYDLVVDSTLLEKLDIDKSIEGRAGAVQTLAGQTTGSADTTSFQRIEMAPAWDRTPRTTVFGNVIYPEQDWVIADASAVIRTGEEPNITVTPGPRAEVYRRFSFAVADPAPIPGGRLVAEILINRDGDLANGVWKRVEIQEIDFESMTLLLKEPALKNPAIGFGRYNVNEPGRAKGTRVHLAWASSGAGSAQINIPSIRFPAQGYSGTVVEMAPVRGRTVKHIAIPAGVNREAYARFAHAAISEPLVRGEVPIVGPLPTALWAMGRRVNIRSDQHGPTGNENIRAPVKGIRVEFERGGSASVQLSRDTASLVEGGSA
ncbi:MAG: hypothetical protein IT450_11420 [Phycisphaerales bacterium]|nr:hypothetical protein [Phycisphaerales bacterium]